MWPTRGSTTAILCNLPGEATSVVTCLDGHKLAQSGRTGAALSIATLSSFLAGCVATLIITFTAPPIASVALSFDTPEHFALMAMGLAASVVFSNGSILKAAATACLGVVLGLAGNDVETGTQRFTFGNGELSEGVGLVAISMALFGLAEIVATLSDRERRGGEMARPSDAF